MGKFECKSCVKEPTGHVNIMRFIDKLDSFFKSNDLVGADEHIEFWESEARKLNDSCGLLSILNEKLGYTRRVKDKERGLKTVDEVLELLEYKGLTENNSGATIYINVATTLKEFNEAEKALPLYEEAKKILIKGNKQNTYEFATLLNNESSTLIEVNRLVDAEKSLLLAIEILEKIGSHEIEIALSYINLAHLIFDRDEDYERVESLLDKCWELINADIPHDANYAYIISKIAPSLKYFNREIEGEALEEISKEIYDGKK